MANFPTPSEINQIYLQTLKAVNPAININDANSDFVLRGKVFSGVISGVYGDQAKIYNDTFISSMRPEALIKKGIDLGISKQPATQAISDQVQITGTNGKVVAAGDLTFLYGPTNLTYTNTSGGTIAGGVLTVAAQADVYGQAGNIIAPDDLQVVSPPSGVGTVAQILDSFTDGSDIESDDSFRQRLLSFEQQAPAGGNEKDYETFAFAADSSVRSAFVVRFARGYGTVDVYITTGTTDVDSAVTTGAPVIRAPSETVLENVQAYLDSHAPLTDCPRVYAPQEVTVNVTVDVTLANGLSLSSVVSSAAYNPLNLTVQQLIQREIMRAMYKTPVGGRKIISTGNGYLYASDLENDLDVWLSAVIDPVTGLYIGKIPVLADRRVAPLTNTTVNLPLTQNQIPTPGTITVVLGV